MAPLKIRGAADDGGLSKIRINWYRRPAKKIFELSPGEAFKRRKGGITLKQNIPIINKTLELSDVRGKWFLDETYNCWCLEDILYTLKATTPKFQRMSIFVPAEYMKEGGEIVPDGMRGIYTAETAPVIFANNAAGYMQMPHTWLGGPRDVSEQFLKRGMVFVTCGSRGRESRDENGKLCGKSPWTLIDLKTAIRFLRHNKALIPGNLDHIISTGWSAGGAMSSLLGLTGDNPLYTPFLEKNGAFMDESDAVYGTQAYCPILDLDHADLAYEWQFNKDPENESSPAGPAGTFTPFREALSGKLSAAYIKYFNGLGLKNPETGETLVIEDDARSGSGYDYLMKQIEASAAKYLKKLSAGELDVPYTVEDYLTGNYTHEIDAPMDMGDDDLGLHHAGAAVAMPTSSEEDLSGPPSLGDLVSRPPKGVPYMAMEIPQITVKGNDKHNWLTWDGNAASITGLDDYILNHRRRMKPCTAFDTLGADSGENQEFGTPEEDYMHYNPHIARPLAELKDAFPEEYSLYYEGFAKACSDEELAKRRFLINPMNFTGAKEGKPSPYFRVRVGGCDADTSFMISMSLALACANAGIDTDYAIVWDQPHCDADYPGEFCDWIERICL